MKNLCFCLICLCSITFLSAQKNCDKVVRLNQRMTEFLGENLKPLKYCMQDGYLYIVSNETDKGIYDLIFDPYTGWGCTSSLNVRLFNFEDNSLMAQLSVKEEDVKHLYLTSFPDNSKNLIIRLDDIQNLNLIYRLTISDDQNREIYNSGTTGINFEKYVGKKSCND
jgi:hypothetical protein